jgi:hypothetical protein
LYTNKSVLDGKKIPFPFSSGSISFFFEGNLLFSEFLRDNSRNSSNFSYEYNESDYPIKIIRVSDFGNDRIDTVTFTNIYE